MVSNYKKFLESLKENITIFNIDINLNTVNDDITFYDLKINHKIIEFTKNFNERSLILTYQKDQKLENIIGKYVQKISNKYDVNGAHSYEPNNMIINYSSPSKEKLSQICKYYGLSEKEIKINTITIGTNINYTYLIDEVIVDYTDIVKKFGEGEKFNSEEYAGDKIDIEWRFEIDLHPFTIYNWKDGKNYCGDDGLYVENIVEWHIGGNDKSRKCLPVLKSFLDIK